tara:strand:- start:1948 stop:2142 length:195 start_codon:yes stop_codon:yes gene_type:complete
MSDMLEGLETVAANVETEYMLVKENINNILKKGWEQVKGRIEALLELEAVKNDLDNKWREYDEC